MLPAGGPPLTDLKKLTPKQSAHYSYMMDVMARLEWDFHNTIEMTGRIPDAWHEIARRTPRRARCCWEHCGS